MNELNFSQQLDESFRNITTFFEEIAIILRDCDRLMGENGYTIFSNRNKTLAVYEMSKSLENPKGWIPSYVGRAYVLEDDFEDNSYSDIKFISIFLRYGSGGTHDVEMVNNIPLIVAGVIYVNNPDEYKFEPWDSKSWFWKDNSDYDKYQSDEYHRWINADAKADGTVVKLYPSNDPDWANVKKLLTFAYHLEDIKSTKILKEKIVDKIIEINDEFEP